MADERPMDQYEEWKKEDELDELAPKDRFRKTTHIALLLSYDLIDKLRYWEKETLELPEDQVAKRQEHMTKFIDQLREAYVTFAEVDL